MKRFLRFIHQLNRRQTLGVIAIAIGAALLLFVKRSMDKVNAAKSAIDHVSDFFTNSTGIWNPVITFFGGKAQEKASEYDPLLSFLLVVGIALIALGVFIVYRFRKA